MIEVKAPQTYISMDWDDYQYVFLGGSIEMGKAENWQKQATSYFEGHDIVVFNPRRDDWDSSWKQDINNPQFKEQVTWELDSMMMADYIIFNFLPDTMSPITLLELGLYAKTKKIIVVCPEGYWRKGNVDIVCERFCIKQCDTLEAACNCIKRLTS